MATADDAALDDDNNVDDSDGVTGVGDDGDDGDGGGATVAAVVDVDNGGYDDNDGVMTATVRATA